MEVSFGLPAELGFDLDGIDGVAVVVARSIGDVTDVLAVGVSIFPRMMTVHDLDDLADQLHVAPLGTGSDIVGFTGLSGFQNTQQGVDVVGDVDPVADVLAIAVDRDVTVVAAGVDDGRHEFFGMLPGPEVVAAVGDQRRQSVGDLPRADQMVGRGFGRGIGAAGGVV